MGATAHSEEAPGRAAGAPRRWRAFAEWVTFLILWSVLVAAPFIALDRVSDPGEQNMIGEMLGMTGLLFVPIGVAIGMTLLLGYRMRRLLASDRTAMLAALSALPFALVSLFATTAAPGHIFGPPASGDPTHGVYGLVGPSLFLIAVAIAGVVLGRTDSLRRVAPARGSASQVRPGQGPAAFCAVCGTYVWLQRDGTCQYGHPASQQSGHYLACPQQDVLAADRSARGRTPGGAA